MKKLLIIAILYVLLMLKTFGNLENRNLRIQVKNLEITKCDNTDDYNVTVNNVSVRIENTKIKVSGSLSAKINLNAPISAKLWIERDILGIWIPIPCEKNLGSCNYPDLCKFGLAQNKSCPGDFLENNVPCRCPISKGNYTIKQTLGLSQETSIEAGSYKGGISVMQNQSVISCYNFKFELYDGEFDKKSNIVLEHV